MLIKNKTTKKSPLAKPKLLTYPRLKARQLFMKFRRVKLDYLEAQLRPVEQLDRRPPWTAGGRTIQEYRAGAPVVEKSRSRDCYAVTECRSSGMCD